MTSRLKQIFITIILLVGCLCVQASPILYIAPENGSYNVDMGSDKYPERIEHQRLRYATGLFSDPLYYSSQQCLLTMGVSDYNSDRNADGSPNYCAIRFRIDSEDMGFSYISGTVPGASRPYRLYAVVNFRTENVAAKAPLDVFEVMPDTLYTIDPVILTGSVSATDGEVTSFWVDIILCLPGADTLQNNVLYYDGRRYVLAAANDYVTSMGVRISLRDTVTQEEKYSRSEHNTFGGYYRTSSTLSSNNCMLLVNPIGAGYRLNLLKYGTISTIAELGFRLRYSQRTRDSRVASHSITDVGYHPDTATVFMSSSSDPFVQGDKFRFVHTGNPSILSPSNSIGFDIMVTSHDAGNAGVTIFDGTDWYDTSYGGVAGHQLPVMYLSQYIYHNGEYTAWASYDGEIAVRLGDNGDTILQSGTYEENVYIHVITEENPRSDQISWFY